jgi:hypothetical protein
LPAEAGEQLSLTGIERQGMAVSLRYTVATEVSEEKRPSFEAYIARTVQSVFCDGGAKEVRFLNDHGVSFSMVYADPAGKTVKALEIPPNFCA